MKRFLCPLLALALLAGCSAPGTLPAATAETAAAPTPAPQQLTVYYAAGAESPAGAALRAYAAAQGVELTELGPQDDPAAADLAVLQAEPAADGSWLNLREDTLLATAAARGGLTREDGLAADTVYALPLGKALYAYWADGALLAALLGGGQDAVTADLQAASWEEWSSLAETLTEWLAEPAETTVTLNGRDYALPAERPAEAAGLTGVFSLCAEPMTAGGGSLPLYTSALLAAGAESQAAAAQAVAGGTALFYRGSLAGWRQYTGSALAESLVWLPVKCDLVQSDLGDTEYNLTGLLNYPVLAGEAWLGIPAGASEQGRQAAAAAMLWLYTSQAGEETLTQTLGLVTPWGTASDDDPLAAMQVEQVGAGILPQPVPNTAQAAALAEAGRALLYTEDGAARESFGSAVRTAWREAAVQALAEPEAADAQAG